MKKKNLIFIAIVVFILLISSLFTSYIDSARVRNGVEPKFTIKFISKNGKKVTYWGLGYKVVRYPSVSPNEPYENNRGVKYGSWFMNYVLDNEFYISKIEVIESKNANTNKFNKYLEKEGIIVYISSDIDNIYYYGSKKNTLNEYVLNTYQTLEDSISNLTDEMESDIIAKDGGSRIYHKKSINLAILKCNVINGSKDIYIGTNKTKLSINSLCHNQK